MLNGWRTVDSSRSFDHLTPTPDNNPLHRSWLVFWFFSVVSFVYASWFFKVHSRWSASPVNLVVELSRFAGFGSLLFDQSTFDSARVGVSNLVALTLSREGSGAWVGAIASKPTTPATVDPSARRGLVWSRTPTTQVIP